MDVSVRGISGVKCSVKVPPSKSYTHRALAVAGLAEGESVIKNYLKAGDTISTMNALKAFGIGIEKKGLDELVVHGSRGKLRTPKFELDCENSGTTIRLMSSVAALDGKVTLTGDSSLQKRPMQPLLDTLNQLGVRAYSVKGDGTPPVVVEGKGMKGGHVKIKGDVSSQFISSILLSAPYAENDVELEMSTSLKSRPYVDITMEIMDAFGVPVKNEDYKIFTVESGMAYRGRKYTVEGDYSSGAYFFALAALTGSRASVEGLREKSIQADRLILDILADMGSDTTEEKGRLTVIGGTPKPMEVDLGDAPDLLPTVTALLCKADGRSIIRNVAHARFKESDRIAACAREFSKFGVKIVEQEDGLVIEGKRKLNGAIVESGGDHRMAMALTIMGLSADGSTTIKNADCVDISFPGFYDIISSIK